MRAYEFKQAVKYLLNTFPPQSMVLPLKLDISFLKKNCTDRGSIGDYYGGDRLGFHEVTMRIAYGLDGNSRDTIRTLFHEYKHLLQDAEGYLHSVPIEHEADDWAVEQFPVYLEWLAKETESRRNTNRSKRDMDNGIEYVTFIMNEMVYTLTKMDASDVLTQLSTKLS